MNNTVIYSDDDIALAHTLINLGKTGLSAAELDEKAEALIQEHEEELAKRFGRIQADRLEQSYLKLLAAHGGDADRLARSLFDKLTSTYTPLKESDSHQGKSGRPPSRWGEGGVGKLFVYMQVEDIRRSSNPKLKVRNAIVKLLKIPIHHLDRTSVKAKIADYAARYSEAKKILKLSGKEVTFS